MGILHSLTGEKEDKKDLYILLIISGLYSLSIALSNTFVNIYLWKQSGDYLDIGIYNLIVVAFQPITFILAGRLAKKVDRVIVLRLGVIFLTLFYLTVLLSDGRATDFLWLFGTFLGIGWGFYWLAFNVLTFEITEPDTRDFFNGTMGVLTSSAGMIGPITAGFIISRINQSFGYSIVFSLSLCFFAVAVVLSFSLKRRPAHGKYYFIRVLQERKNNRDWRLITYAHFFQGIREGTFMFVISILVFIQTGSELALGSYGLLHSAISFITYYFASRYIKPPNRNKAILFGGILLYTAVVFITVKVTYVRLLIYASMIAIAYPILLVPYISLTYDIIGRAWNAAEMRIEYIVTREIFIHFGRMVSILGFLVAVLYFEPKQSIPIFLLIAGLGHTMIYFFIRNIKLSSDVG